MSNKFALTDPEQIANEGERIYDKNLRERLDASYKGQYVAIDVLTGKHYLGEYAEVALMNAREDASFGVFYLIKIGGSTLLGARYIEQKQPSWYWSLRRAE